MNISFRVSFQSSRLKGREGGGNKWSRISRFIDRREEELMIWCGQEREEKREKALKNDKLMIRPQPTDLRFFTARVVKCHSVRHA